MIKKNFENNKRHDFLEFKKKFVNSIKEEKLRNELIMMYNSSIHHTNELY